MYSDAVIQRPARANSAAYTTAIFGLLGVALVLRIALPAPFVDLFMDYTADTGSIAEKIHPGTYAICAVFALAVSTLRAHLDAWSHRALRGLACFAIAIAGLIAYLVLVGRVGSAGYLIDTYLSAILAGMSLLLLPAACRVRAGTLVLVLLIVSAGLGFAEFATRTRIMPYPIPEIGFRATGLAGHPLSLGLMSATALLFAGSLGWRRASVLLAGAILFLGVASAGARIAMLAASLAVVVAILASPMGGASAVARQRVKALLMVAGAIGLAGAITFLAFSGFLERFSRGLSDPSAMARVDVYKLFLMTDWTEVVFGTDVARIAKLAEERLNLLAIESSFVVAIYQFGIIGALVFAGALVATARRLASGAPAPIVVAVLIFFAVALSNNTLTSKTPTVTMLFVLLIAAQAYRLPRNGQFS